MKSLKSRLLREEGGFTLVELLVTMVMMTIVMFALYSIFDTGIRVFSFGNDKVDAAENARLGLEKMEREVRAAYPYDKAGVGGSASETIIASSIVNLSDTIRFGNDLNGDRTIDTSAGSKEDITYKLSGGSPPALLRNGQPVVENVKPGGLTFEYLDRNGAQTTTESQVALVRITLKIEIDRGSLGKRTQTLTTDVALRNRTG